jgi:GT2 family glycosyltransferase
MADADLSIIVANYNTMNLLRNCLRSIDASTRGIEFETIVVDDCSKDGSPEMVRKEFPQVRLACNLENMRYARSNNAGLRMARGRYALLLNSDVEVQDGAFAELVGFMDEHPDVAAAGPKLINPDGSIQHCIRSFPGVWPMFFQSIGLHKIWPNNPITNRYYNTDFDYDREQPVQSIGTTSFIIRRSIWEQYGMLDERFSLYFVDLAYCFMLGRNSEKIYYVPQAVVMHYGGQTINQSSEKEIRLLHDGLRDFYDAYYSRCHRPWTRLAVRAGIWLRYRLKMAELALSPDNRVIKGPGVGARLSPEQTPWIRGNNGAEPGDGAKTS